MKNDQIRPKNDNKIIWRNWNYENENTTHSHKVSEIIDLWNSKSGWYFYQDCTCGSINFQLYISFGK